MSKQPSPLRRFLTAFTNVLEPVPAAWIFGLGIVTWILVTAFFGWKSGENALFFAFSDGFGAAWQTAFLWSLAAVAVASAIYCVRAKASLLAVAANTMIYASPYALFLLGVWTLDGLYDQHPSTVETTRIFGPLLIFFYVLGTLYMRWRAPKGRDESFPFFMLSTVTPVLLILGMAAFKLLTSNDYIYRNAFDMMVDSVKWEGDQVEVLGTLSLNKPGNYAFSAINNDEMEMDVAEFPKPLVIEWKGASGQPSQVGTHPFRIRQENPRLAKRRALREAHREDPDAPPFFYGPEISLQINLVAQDGKPGAFIKSLPFRLEEFAAPWH